MTEFDIYKEYLINVAKKEGRPFRLPKDESKFIERPDYTLFYGLMKELEKKDIKSLKDMKEFMSNARWYLENSFYIRHIVDNVEFIIKYQQNNENKETMKFDSFAIIKKSFETLTETCLLENIKYENINIGSPSLLLKLWKKGKVDKVTTVYLGDLKDYKQ